jgi:hypothetical protein
MSTVAPAACLPSALPVAVALDGPVGDAVRGHVEAVLGWQVVPAGDDLVPPTITLLGVGGAAPHRVSGPVVLLLADGDDPTEVAAVAAAVRPVAAVRWPDERGSLPERVGAALAARPPRGGGGRLVRVGGAAGGVGTSTVALALGGLTAWDGQPTTVAVGASAPGPDVAVVPADALRHPATWRRATALPGVTRCRAVRLVGAPPADLVAPDGEVAVVDAAVRTDVDVLVARPDAAGLAAIEATTAGAVVVVGRGPASTGAVRRAVGGRRLVALPVDERVARAALRARLPAGVPGRWVTRLRPLVPTRPPDG